jgi:hypothetical protein
VADGIASIVARIVTASAEGSSTGDTFGCVLSSEQPAIASIAAVKRKIFRMVLFCWLRNIWLVEIRVAGFARVGQTFRTAVAYRL